LTLAEFEGIEQKDQWKKLSPVGMVQSIAETPVRRLGGIELG
jgi:hypothetical protein